MTKRQKPEPSEPDEVFSNELFSVARFGKNLVWEPNLTKQSYEKCLKRCAELYPETVSEIDRLVATIAEQVRRLPPETLLSIAWQKMVFRHIHVEAEAELTTNDAVSMRMIDYVQSIIASVEPVNNPKTDVSEEDWDALRDNVKELFETLNINYQICRTAKAKSEDPDHNDDFEEFRFRAQVYWCNVRGKLYQAHQETYLRDVFLPHSAEMVKLFGISSEEFIEELTKIWNALSYGYQQALEEMATFQKDTMAAVEEKMATGSLDKGIAFEELLKAVVEENGWQERSNKVFGRFLGSNLCNVQKTTALPKKLLDELSWGQGDDTDFFAEGEFKGWPLRIWPTFKRPFIQIAGQYYCFDLHSLFDNIYRIMQRIILRMDPTYVETWNKTQKELSESLPFKYLSAILPGATGYQSAHYKWFPKESKTKKDWCEVDGMLIYDDHLFIIECRGGAFTYTSPATDFPAFVNSLKNLVLKPANQGKRFLDYLSSSEAVPIFDKKHNQIRKLRKSDFRHISICLVTLDSFTEMAAQVQHLHKIGVNTGPDPVWAISVDDLRVYADIFENPLHFLHYVQQRSEAFKSDIVQVDDELDHLGLYLKHNHYSTHATRIRGDSQTRINFNGYRSSIDKFFLERMRDPRCPCPLKQDSPPRFTEIIDWLASSNEAGRSKLACYLLDLHGDARNSLSAYIDGELNLQPTTRRPKPYSTHGGNTIGCTIFCYTDNYVPRNAKFALYHSKTVMILAEEPERLLIEISYSDNNTLQGVEWTWLNSSSIPAAELAFLKANAETLRKSRLKSAKLTKEQE